MYQTDPVTWQPIDPMTGQPIDPMQQGGPMSQFMGSPGMAMTGQAIQNMMNMRRGMAAGPSPILAMQQAQRQNEMLLHLSGNGLRSRLQFGLQVLVRQCRSHFHAPGPGRRQVVMPAGTHFIQQPV